MGALGAFVSAAPEPTGPAIGPVVGLETGPKAGREIIPKSVLDRAQPLESLEGTGFAKMTGSGNDFVVFDGRSVNTALLKQPEVIAAICNRNNGIGADGLVILEPVAGSDAVEVSYFNSDGSAADLCGNATLCSTAMSVELGLASASGMKLVTGAGTLMSHMEGKPALEFQPVLDIRPELAIDAGLAGPLHQVQRIGFVMAGIPHVVILCSDANAIDVAGLGPGLRWHPALGAEGANVNWVSSLPGVSGKGAGRWRYRTFERGVEAETLACGTGAVAVAAMLGGWGLLATAGNSGGERAAVVEPSTEGLEETVNATARGEEVFRVDLVTSSGRTLEVLLRARAGEGGYRPTLKGEGRVVFRGTIGDLPY